MFLPNFREQTVQLVLLPDLDTAVGKYAENNEHTDFYVENLCPTKVTNRDLPPVEFSHFTITGKLGYNTTYPVTSNSHTYVQHPWTLTHVLVSPRPRQFTQLQKNEFSSLLHLSLIHI